MNQGHTCRLGLLHAGKPPRFSLDQQLSFIRRLHPGEDLHQGAFACTVLPDESHYFSLANLQIHTRERDHTREALRHPPYFQETVSHYLPSFSFKSFQKASTLSLRIMRAGMSMSLFSGMTESSPVAKACNTLID